MHTSSIRSVYYLAIAQIIIYHTNINYLAIIVIYQDLQYPAMGGNNSHHLVLSVRGRDIHFDRGAF